MGYKRWFAEWVFIMLMFTIALPFQTIETMAVTKRNADVSIASKGNEMLGVWGTFEPVKKTKILKRINEIRMEACKKGYKDPATGKKLTLKDYVPITWSADLEWIADLRAAEATVKEDHDRPNGKAYFTVSHNEIQSEGENLAWNESGILEGIEQWYDEKKSWASQDKKEVTDHYENMISTDYVSIGIGSFQRKAGGRYGIAAEFGRIKSKDKSQAKLEGMFLQLMEVERPHTGPARLTGPTRIRVGESRRFHVYKSIAFPEIIAGTNETSAQCVVNMKWHSSNPKVAAVDAFGKVEAKKKGTAVIRAVVGKKMMKKTIQLVG